MAEPRLSRLQLLRELHRHSVLATRRSPLWAQGRTARVVGYFAAGLVALCFIGISLLFAFLVKSDGSVSAVGFMSVVLPFVLFVDFSKCFVQGVTTAQRVKPYLLLPIPKRACADSMLIGQLLNPGILFWQTLFAPFGIVLIAMDDRQGILSFLDYAAVLQVAVMINTLWYSLMRTLTERSHFWWALPAVVYGIVALPIYTSGSLENGINAFGEFYSSLGDWLWSHQLVLWGALAAGFVAMFSLCRAVLFRTISGELETERDSSRTGSAPKLSFAGAGNATALFFRLEIASAMRNKNVRKHLIDVVTICVLISACLSLTSMFSDEYGMKYFWICYSFMSLPMTYSSRIMEYEGNYIDFLMVHRNSLLNLLRAKFYFICAAELLPLVLLLPTVFAHSYSMLQLVSYMLFSAGFINFAYFQLAVYNNDTVPLNTKAIASATAGDKGQMKFRMMIMMMLILISPYPIIVLSEVITGSENTENYVLAFIGLAFILTSNLWLKNIYRRMMARKYANLEAFRATRVR